MTHEGTDLKYKVTADIEDFSMIADNFDIAIINRWGKTVKTIKKSDCLWDDDYNCYISIDGLTKGVYRAKFTAYILDDDYEKGDMHVTDMQVLANIGVCDCECSECECSCECGCQDGHKVHYERVYTSGGNFLVDKNNEFIVTSEGNYIVIGSEKFKISEDMGRTKLNMTGKEFKELIEGRNDNGKIDTLHEALDALENIGEDTELDVMTQDDTRSMMDNILGRNQR